MRTRGLEADISDPSAIYAGARAWQAGWRCQLTGHHRHLLSLPGMTTALGQSFQIGRCGTSAPVDQPPRAAVTKM